MTLNDQFSQQELDVLLRELRKILDLDIAGDVVELGCYKGMTSLEIQKILQPTNKILYVYDSFSGLPVKVAKDQSPAGVQFKAGELPASKQDVIKLFKQHGIKLPVIKKAWFNELTKHDIPSAISFAFLDGDFYESILDSLTLIWDRLSKGAVVLVDDYQNEALPGAQKAVDEWLKLHPSKPNLSWHI